MLGALHEALLDKDGVPLSLPGDVTPNSLDDLTAITIGVASDKNLSITPDTIEALDVIMELGIADGLTEEQADQTYAAIALDAEAVREAVLAAHDY